MFRFIDGLPSNVLAFEAIGEITHKDYHDALIPKAEAMMANGPVKMMYVVGAAFTDFDLEALWDDGAFGLRHWREFSHIAVVTDHAWLRAMVSMFSPLMPGEVRLFRLSALPLAKDWIVAAKPARGVM